MDLLEMANTAESGSLKLCQGCTSGCPSRLARAFQSARLRVSAEACALG
jgi:hypothetical protein